jgi:Na+/melibiose symporter-like transporter
MMLRLVGELPANHTPLVFWIVFGQTVVSTALGIAGATMVSAMIADVVEEGELKTGRRAEGLFFSASTLVAKAVSGVGVFAASMILALVHFPTGARPGEVPQEVVRHLALVYAPIILVLYGVGLALMFGYRITRASHALTLEALAARAAGATLATQDQGQS